MLGLFVCVCVFCLLLFSFCLYVLGGCSCVVLLLGFFKNPFSCLSPLSCLFAYLSPLLRKTPAPNFAIHPRPSQKCPHGVRCIWGTPGIFREVAGNIRIKLPENPVESGTMRKGGAGRMAGKSRKILKKRNITERGRKVMENPLCHAA